MSAGQSVTFVIEDSQGNSASITLPGPGGVMRVVVGEPGKQSGVWRVFAPEKNYGDVYIGVRSLLGEQKWSLHESGDWRFQWVSKAKAVEHAKTNDRIIDQWQQPKELGGAWTKGFSIRVRHQDLVEVENAEAVPADAVWVPAPPEGHVAAIHVVIARLDQGVVELRGLLPFDGLMLADGRVLLLVHSVEPIPDEVNQSVDNALAAAIQQVPVGVLDAAQAPRALLAGNNAQGDRHVWDVAIRRGVPMRRAN